MEQNHVNEYFSISEGGPFNRAVQKIGLNTNAKQIVVALCITWLPLLIITAFEGTIAISQMKRTPEELVSFVFRECSFPYGCLIMTGTGIVPEW